MRYTFFILISSILCYSTNFFKSCAPSQRNNYLKSNTIKEIDSTIFYLEQLKIGKIKGFDLKGVKDTFLQSRLHYKKTESVIEYYFQGLTKRINGPALPDVKIEDGQVFPPNGFQVIEQIIFATPMDDSARIDLNESVDRLVADFRFIKTNLQSIEILPRHAAELLQHELLRIATIGITGADAPLSKYSIVEAAAALQGLKLINELPKDVADKIGQAINFTNNHSNFDDFNRLEFITKYLMPISDSYFTFTKKEMVNDSFPKPFMGSMAQLLRGESINPDFYTPYKANASNPEKYELGKLLFYDKRLSKKSNMSCASCHKPELYFTDGLDKAVGNIHGKSDRRNTPSIYYAALQASQFYDMRNTYLEDQVNEVMKSNDEFNLTADEIANRLGSNEPLKRAFAKAYPNNKEITGLEVRNAIAVFIRKQIPFSSHFDKYMRGGFTMLNADEIQGFNLFAGKAKCATCHFIPWFNGNVPPWYTKSESEIIGVPTQPIWEKATIDADLGRYRINQFEELKHAFKTPSIRNVEKTAPYMHNGVYKNLEEVVKFYHLGGGVGIGIDLPFQSLPFDSLILNSKEQAQIVSFMKSLTDSIH